MSLEHLNSVMITMLANDTLANMNTATSDRIYYTLYSKDSADQSLRTKGAVKSYQIVRDFLEKVAVDIKINNPTLMLGLWETKREGMAEAKRVKQLLINTYGQPSQTTHSKWLFSFQRHIEEYTTWNIGDREFEDTLKYVDSLGPLTKLNYRPPISVSVEFDFWLKHPDIIQGDKATESSLVAFFSANSNAAALMLVTPYKDVNDDFISFRADFQKDCPFPLLDKNFYIRRFNKAGEEYYRHAYTLK